VILFSSSLLANSRLQVLLGPLVDAVEGLLQILQRVGYAEAQVALAEFTEGSPGECSDSSLLE
jgi:hypothetical protein